MRIELLLQGALISSMLIFSTATARSESGNEKSQTGKTAETAAWRCMNSRYPGFKGDKAVLGFMPGRLEQEAICLSESDDPFARKIRDERGGESDDPVALELLKLRIMERIAGDEGGGGHGVNAVFSGSLVKNPPRKYLGIAPGTRPEQAPRMDTSGVRERVPDLLRSLDRERAPWIYWFHRSDERVAALCIDPKEDGSCGRIEAKAKKEDNDGKNEEVEEEGKFKSFMKKVKSSFSGPEPKETYQWKTVDFYGVRLSEVAYAFNYDFEYVGFFARIAEREPFAAKDSPQYIRDVFRALIRQFGDPALKFKEPDPTNAGVTDSHGIWITADGFRIDALCVIPATDSGICTDGRLSVRRLPQVKPSRSTEGAGFFE